MGKPPVALGAAGELAAIPTLHLWLHPPHVQVPTMPMYDYANHDMLTEQVAIPGSRDPVASLPDRDVEAKKVMARPNLLLILRHSYDCIRLMHQAGYSLNGQFGVANLLVYPSLDVRMTGRLHITSFTQDTGDRDYTAFASCVEEFLCLRETVPPHVSRWLNIIRQGVIGDEYLIRYNTALMAPTQVFSTFMSLRRTLESLHSANEALYTRIVNSLPEYNLWHSHFYACVNRYMEKARKYQVNRTGLENPFDQNIRGVLTLCRHCSEHPGFELEEDFMLLIVEDDFPELASNFQTVMFREGWLLPLNLEQAMG
nr:unnamed protein product [Digitaria exilis]